MYENLASDTLLQVFRPADALGAGAAPDRPALFTEVRHGPAPALLGTAHVVPGGPASPGAGTPGFWERHDDGDEVLLVLAGHATFTADRGGRTETVDVHGGDVLRVAAGAAHTAVVHTPLDVVFLLPPTGNESWVDGTVPAA